MSCCLPKLEQYRAMDDMADWGVTHLKEPPCPVVIEAQSADKGETAQSEVQE